MLKKVTFFVSVIASLFITHLASAQTGPLASEASLKALGQEIGDPAAAEALGTFLNDKDDHYFKNVADYLFKSFSSDMIQSSGGGSTPALTRRQVAPNATAATVAFAKNMLTIFPEVYQNMKVAMGRGAKPADVAAESVNFVRRLVRYSSFQTFEIPHGPANDPNYSYWAAIGPYDRGHFTETFITTDTHGDFPTLVRSLLEGKVFDADISSAGPRGSVWVDMGDKVDGKPYAADSVKSAAVFKAILAAAGITNINLAGNHEVLLAAGLLKRLTPEDLEALARTTVGKNGDLDDLRMGVSGDFTDPKTIFGQFINQLTVIVKINSEALVHAGWDVWGDPLCNGNTPDRVNYTFLQWVLAFQGLRPLPPMNTAWVMGIKSVKTDAQGKYVVKFTHDEGPLMMRTMGNTFTKLSKGKYELKLVNEPSMKESDRFPGSTRAVMSFLLAHALGVNHLNVGHKPNKSGRVQLKHSYYSDVTVWDRKMAFGGTGGMGEITEDGTASIVTVSGNKRYQFPNGTNGETALENARVKIGSTFGKNEATANDNEDDVDKKKVKPTEMISAKRCADRLKNREENLRKRGALPDTTPDISDN